MQTNIQNVMCQFIVLGYICFSILYCIMSLCYIIVFTSSLQVMVFIVLMVGSCLHYLNPFTTDPVKALHFAMLV